MNFFQQIFSQVKRVSQMQITLMLVFLISLILVSPVFFPAYHDINPDDEAKYINSGVELLRGQLRDLAWGPLLAVIYAPAFLLTQHSPYWFFGTAGLGHLLIFALLWWSSLTLAKRFEQLVNPLLMAGLLSVFGGTTLILGNSSFAMFSVFSALALAQTIAYYQSQEIRYLWQASVWIGLAALVRNDGLILFLSFLLIIASLRMRARQDAPMLHIRHALAAVLPFVAIVAGYLFISTWPNVNFEIGTMRRTYLAFEQGQWVLGGDMGWDDAIIESRRWFGTPEENDYNVFKAIARNPQMYMTRLKVMLTGLPDQLLAGYGKRMTVALAFLALVGVWALMQRRAFGVILILAVWPLHLLAYGLTFFQPGYLLMPYFLMLILAALGINFLLRETISLKERLAWSGFLLAVLIYTLLDHKMALLAGMAILASCLWLGWFLQSAYQPKSVALAASLMLMLAGGLILRDRFPFPDFTVWGSLAEEQSIVFLQEHFPADSRLATCVPLPAIAARMQPISLPSDDPAFDFDAWLQQEHLDGIYVDSCIRQKYPALMAWIEGEIGNTLASLTIIDPGSIEILDVR